MPSVFVVLVLAAGGFWYGSLIRKKMILTSLDRPKQSNVSYHISTNFFYLVRDKGLWQRRRKYIVIQVQIFPNDTNIIFSRSDYIRILLDRMVFTHYLLLYQLDMLTFMFSTNRVNVYMKQYALRITENKLPKLHYNK